MIEGEHGESLEGDGTKLGLMHDRHKRIYIVRQNQTTPVMKYTLFLSLVILLSTLTFAQDEEMLFDVLPMNEGRVTYSEVVAVEGIDKDKLFARASKWFAEAYKSAEDVIQFSDKEAGEIMGRGFFTTHWSAVFYSATEVDIWYETTIQFKEGRYRYVLTDFRIKYDTAISGSVLETDLPIEEWNVNRENNMKKFLPKIDEHVQSMIASMKEALAAPVVSDDW